MAISAIIPTHQRLNSLYRLVHVLLDIPNIAQIVIIDSPVAYPEPFQLRDPRITFVCALENSVSLKRNLGVEASRFDTLIFLDDDVTPAPCFQDYLSSLKFPLTAVLCGLVLYPSQIGPKADRFMEYRNSRAFYNMRLSTRRPNIGSFVSMFFIIDRMTILGVGGFDENVRGYGGEEYSLPLALAERSIPFIVDHKMLAQHHEVDTSITKRAEKVGLSIANGISILKIEVPNTKILYFPAKVMVSIFGEVLKRTLIHVLETLRFAKPFPQPLYNALCRCLFALVYMDKFSSKALRSKE
jgi:hypothetical protein